MPALAVVALIVVFTVVQVTLSANADLDRRIESEYLPAVTMSRQLVELLAALQRGIQDAVASADPAILDETDVLRDSFLDIVAEAELNETVASEQIDSLGRDFQAYYSLARQTSSRLINGEISADLQRALRDTVERYNALRAVLVEIS